MQLFENSLNLKHGRLGAGRERVGGVLDPSDGAPDAHDDAARFAPGLPLAGHLGHHVRRGGAGKPGGCGGAVRVQEGAEGDDVLHAGVRHGGDGPPRDVLHQSRGDRDVRGGSVARRRAALPLLLLLHAVLRLGRDVHPVRHGRGALPRDQPRVLLLAARGPYGGAARLARGLRGERGAVRDAQFRLRASR